MYYGWLIVAGAFIAQFFVTGFFTYGFPLMVIPVEAEFGVSRTEVMYGITWATGLGLLISPLVGTLADKWSIRGLMAIGAACSGPRFDSTVEKSERFSNSHWFSPYLPV